MNDDDAIPKLGTHRGVPIHDCQPAERIERVVKPEIDVVFEMSSIDALFAYAADISRPPEARLFAAAKCESSWTLAAEERRVRPDLNLDSLRALVAGLDSVKWRDPDFYCCLLDVRSRAEPAHRLPADRVAVERAYDRPPRN
jgi:hypothetical protein